MTDLELRALLVAVVIMAMMVSFVIGFLGGYREGGKHIQDEIDSIGKKD